MDNRGMLTPIIHHTKKQKEYIRKSNCRWNIKTGAVRSGKSYVDISFTILSRIVHRKGLPGLNVIIGVSRATIERNVLQPMREIYTKSIVGFINASNVCMIAGEPVYCLGAEKASQVAKIQGSSIKYCYGDEIAKWNKEVFEMLKSRLDKEYSCFDGACNPESPTHWLKAFIDSDLDIYVQKYTIFDNEYLPQEYVDNLCKEYAGTIYYQRLIMGEWVRAEGTIYRKYADNPSKFRVTNEWVKNNKIIKINVGVDFGGNGSYHTFVATGFTFGFKEVVALESVRLTGETTPIDLERKFVQFIQYLRDKYHMVFDVYCDSAEQVLIRGFNRAIAMNNLPCVIHNARKMQISERIKLELRLIGLDRLLVNEDAETVNNALIGAVYNDKPGCEDERLDNGTSDIDTLDAFEYSIEKQFKEIIYALERS